MIGKQGEMVAKAVLREIFQNTRGVMYRHAQKVRAILGFKFCFQTQAFFGLFVIIILLVTINSEFELSYEKHNCAIFVCRLLVALLFYFIFLNVCEISVMIKAW